MKDLFEQEDADVFHFFYLYLKVVSTDMDFTYFKIKGSSLLIEEGVKGK